MPVLSPGKAVRSREPTLVVENELAPGDYRFQLVVVDNDQLESDPAELVVRVRTRGRVIPDDVIRPDVIVRPDLVLRPDVVIRRTPVRPTPVEPDPVIRPIRPIRPIR